MRQRMRTLFQNKKEWAKAVNHLIWLEEHTCNAHGVAYFHHPNCYEREYPNTTHKEKMGFLDIEATNLKADFGIVICYCIKPQNSKEIITRCITPKELKSCYDEKVVEHFIRTAKKFDRLIGHYSSRFDTPFLRSRSLDLGLDFPEYKSLWETDTWKIAKAKLCISSNRLANIARLLHVQTEKTPITSQHWLGALTGRRESLDYIVDHCQRDVLILEKVYDALAKFAPRGKTSI